MNQYHQEPIEDEQPQEVRMPQVRIPKTGEIKRAFDFTIQTPGILRKGVARHGDSLLGYTDYNIKLFRSDERKWNLYLEWVDMEGEGHRLVLPHEVVQGILQRANSIIAQARSERAKKATATRKAKGIIPFAKKSK